MLEWSKVYLASDKNTTAIDSIISDVLQSIIIRMLTDSYKSLMSPKPAEGCQALKLVLVGCVQFFAKDDIIIDKNAPVTQDHADALDALADRIAKEQTSHPIRRLIQIVAAATITGFLIFVFGYFLATCEQTTFNQPSQLILLALLTIATAAIASYIKTHELDIYLVPTPLAAMLVTILLTQQIGLVFREHVDLFLGFQILDCGFAFEQVHELVISF